MHKPVSKLMQTGCFTAALYVAATAGSGVSHEALTVDAKVREVFESGKKSQALYGAQDKLINELIGLAETDGVHEDVINEAVRFIQAMPVGLPLPEVSAEPDGAVSLDWLPSKVRMFSISVLGPGRLAYAWLVASNKGHGVARFKGDQMPDELVSLLREIVGFGATEFWAA